MDGSETEKIIKVVDRCPVDALTWKYNDDEKNQDIGPEHPNHIKNRRSSLMQEKDTERIKAATINLMDNGPFVVDGGFLLERENGSRSRFSGTVSLCRCGASKMKPFCDGTHRTIDFKS